MEAAVLPVFQHSFLALFNFSAWLSSRPRLFSALPWTLWISSGHQTSRLDPCYGPWSRIQASSSRFSATMNDHCHQVSDLGVWVETLWLKRRVSSINLFKSASPHDLSILLHFQIIKPWLISRSKSLNYRLVDFQPVISVSSATFVDQCCDLVSRVLLSNLTLFMLKLKYETFTKIQSAEMHHF